MHPVTCRSCGTFVQRIPTGPFTYKHHVKKCNFVIQFSLVKRMGHPRDLKSDTVIEPEYNYVNCNDKDQSKIPLKGINSATRSNQLDDHSRELVLVIDDNPMVRSVIGATLEAAGYTVCAASSGEEGLELFQKFQSRLSAVIVDQCLPALHGDEIVHKIHLSTPRLPVILTSGYYNDDGRPPLEQNGQTVFLAKPFRMTSLLDLLSRCSLHSHN